MKKLLTISFLALMLLLQYSRQVAYLQCKLENISVVGNCDCEKIMVDNTQAGHPGETHHFLFPLGPDEFFTSVHFHLELDNTFSAFVKPLPLPQHFSFQEFHDRLIQPPNV